MIAQDLIKELQEMFDNNNMIAVLILIGILILILIVRTWGEKPIVYKPEVLTEEEKIKAIERRREFIKKRREIMGLVFEKEENKLLNELIESYEPLSNEQRIKYFKLAYGDELPGFYKTVFIE